MLKPLTSSEMLVGYVNSNKYTNMLNSKGDELASSEMEYRYFL